MSFKLYSLNCLIFKCEQIPEKREQLLPVILYIHGGKFSIGSGVSFLSGSTYLMNKRIMFVTINYRHVVMGKFSTVSGVSFLSGRFNLSHEQTYRVHYNQLPPRHFG